MVDSRDHMGIKRRSSEETQDDSRKKAKMGGAPLNQDGAGAKHNPYLAHMYEDEANGVVPEEDSPFAGFVRRKTTAQQAELVEDLDLNPFTGRPHSTRYFGILEGRRDLPVQKQR
jgi:pre-mRNA-splicing factor ATP-dependent RNA helicase DHX15/PRP43